MADEVTMSIGPSGQPPTTVYTYDAGSVTLSPRDAVAHGILEFRTVVARIDAFAAAVRAGGTISQGPPATALDTPMNYRARKQGSDPTIITCEFRSGPLQVDATISIASRVVSFAARPGATVAWSDFELFVQWMHEVADFAGRAPL